MKLSICIPTYNRVELLKESINSILKSIEFSNYEVEIIISDNCSIDNTNDYCLDLMNKYHFIKYFRNEENVNELNFYIAIQRSNADYVWLFSDDDLMNLNSINLVIESLNNNYNIVVANYDLYDNNLSKIMKKNYFNLEQNKVITDRNKLLSEYNLKLGFISCVIFEKKSFLCMPIEVFDKYRPYGFPFVFGLYSSLDDNLNALIISEPLLIQRGADQPSDINWWYKCFVEGSSKIFNELGTFGYKSNAIRTAKRNVYNNYVTTDLIWRKANNFNTYKSIRYLFKFYFIFPYSILKSIIIVLTPNLIFNYAIIIYKRYYTK